jgi:hypothetical protein
MCIRGHAYKWLQNIRLVENNHILSNEWIFGDVGLLFSLARNGAESLEKCIGFPAGKQEMPKSFPQIVRGNLVMPK